MTFSLWLAAALTAGAAAAYARPLAFAQLVTRTRLRLSGVRQVRLSGLNAWEADRCESGRPCRCIALIHGLGDSALTWQKMLLRPEADGARVVAVDLPGTEGSAPPPTPAGYAIPAQAAAVRAALEPVCPRWTVAGNSLGGWIAADLALSWPQGVDGLVLIDAAGLWDPTGAEVAAARVLNDPTVDKLKAFDAKAHVPTHSLPDRVWRELAALIRSRPASAMVAALRKQDLLDRTASRLRLPTRILWGRQDGVVPLSVGLRWHALVRGSQLSIVDRCAHLPQADCPDAAAAAIFDPLEPTGARR